MAIVLADVLAPSHHLPTGPSLLIVAPALAASFASAFVTGAIAAVAVVGMLVIGLENHMLGKMDFWAHHRPSALLRHLRADLLAHVGGHLTDDAAVVAVQRTPEPAPTAAAPAHDSAGRPSPRPASHG
ncbi:hypothetical protein ACH4ND_14580 [Streptomyces sp. NPDC017179]|uniref:hypothetical protein n=1 Tax=Streptomyces sp. NPDC017179 TaxID=3364979 RepID=UPI00378BCC52